jgi:threonine dehydrogenase-like Zn-dependent dehydrogenase
MVRATIFGGPFDITVGERPDPVIAEPSDAVVRVVLGCVCGSDLWYYRGESPHSLGPIGHEFIGVVEAVGSDVRGVASAVSGGVRKGDTVAVVGDGAVGLCAVLAARRLGAGRIIALSRNPDRQAIAREFGATDIVAGRGDEATAKIMELTGGIGVDAALECVGTGQSMATAFAIARVGSVVGAIGAPHDVVVPVDTVIFRNIGLRGGVAPVRRYIPELMPDVLTGAINPGRVFDYDTDLDGVVGAYEAMHERRAIKSLLRISPAA